ncbi:BTAD domain-containing putative transcriptional regulator, partial [Planotetraspora thailandica]
MAEPILPIGGDAGDRSAADSSLIFQILGPLRLWRDGVELHSGPRQQAFLLALLLAREGRPISTDQLIDLIWVDDPPTSALNVIHKYVGSLRRLLEPELSARDSGSYLHRRGNGYLFTAGIATLDLVVFRDLVEAAGTAMARERHEAALDRYVEALGLWQGPAGEGLSPEPAAAAIFSSLDGQFFDACTAAAELAMSLGRPERVLPSLHLAAKMAPLNEPVQASLISTLGAAGQQAEAVSVFRAVRTRLAATLGIDPGQALTTAHQQVLNQNLTATRAAADQRSDEDSPVPSRAVVEPGTPSVVGLIGRTDELTKLRLAMEPAFTGGTGLVVLEGEPGVGKTHVLKELAAEADQRDATVIWGHCLEGEGAPSMWPWVQVVGGVLDKLPTVAREKWLAGELGHFLGPDGDVLGGSASPDGNAQFRLFEAVVAAVGEVAAQRPLVLAIDDLQWADIASLHLFS